MPLPKNAPCSAYVDDFVHSTNKKFSHDSKKQRIKRALGACYSHKEETEMKVNERMEDIGSKPAPNKKPLRQITVANPSAEYVKHPKEKEFAAQHKTQKTLDANGNDDAVFNASKVKVASYKGRNDCPKDSYGKGNAFDDVSSDKNQVVPEDVNEMATSYAKNPATGRWKHFYILQSKIKKEETVLEDDAPWWKKLKNKKKVADKDDDGDDDKKKKFAKKDDDDDDDDDDDEHHHDDCECKCKVKTKTKSEETVSESGGGGGGGGVSGSNSGGDEAHSTGKNKKKKWKISDLKSQKENSNFWGHALNRPRAELAHAVRGEETELSEGGQPKPEEYAPYHKLPAFKEGVKAYKSGNYKNPHGGNSIHGQAWDRGLEYGMRASRVNKEETEINEINKPLASRYLTKALPSWYRMKREGNPKEAKRDKGITRAWKAMAKHTPGPSWGKRKAT